MSETGDKKFHVLLEVFFKATSLRKDQEFWTSQKQHWKQDNNEAMPLKPWEKMVLKVEFYIQANYKSRTKTCLYIPGFKKFISHASFLLGKTQLRIRHRQQPDKIRALWSKTEC